MKLPWALMVGVGGADSQRPQTQALTSLRPFPRWPWPPQLRPGRALPPTS